ncbi:MAG: 16S rRNA (uracil(1498)-N(3))-methyltransferase [Oceanospirillaceae bacterium]
MNLILVDQQDFITTDTIVLYGRRFEHILQVHRAEVAQTLKVGLVNGNSGNGIIISINDQSVTLIVSFLQAPLTPLPLTLILALPRPKMLKRILQSTAALGVKDIYLINSYKVDKSYWSSPVLSPACTTEHLQLGLEQAVDTIMPRIHLKKRFKPFVEDELQAIADNSLKLVAHPYNAHPCPISVDQRSTLVIGPEGGFIDYEIEKLAEQGFQAISLGERILRVETAIPFCIAKLFSC